MQLCSDKPKIFHRRGKSEEHLCVQKTLLEALPHGEAVLELPFSRIGRVADVVWLSKRIVFEVQCSPISLREVLSRNYDYLEEGFQVVWVLHEKSFNRTFLTPAEIFLRGQNSYFTNIFRCGKGMLYNQEERIVFNRRYWRGDPIRVNVQELCFQKKIIKPLKPKFSPLKEFCSYCRCAFLSLLKKVSE